MPLSEKRRREQRLPSKVERHARISADLDEQLPFAERDLRTLDGAHLFLTGGTGFVGTWLLESIAHANERLGLHIEATVLTRNAASFLQRCPQFAQSDALHFIEGDVRALPADLPRFDGIIHGATPASADLNRDAPFEMLDTIIDGGRAIVDLAGRSGSVPLLFTSSGAVYGPAPAELTSFAETYMGAPDPLSPNVAYHEGKRVGEFQCAIAHRNAGVQAKIARLFAFVGPYLPMDRHLAVGNFTGDALHGRSIHITGDGSTVRSYQYAAELVTWLWAIYARGAVLRAYNVGSEEAVTMRELAEMAASCADAPITVEVHGLPQPGKVVDRYLPSTSRVREELGVVSTIPVLTGIRRTLEYLRGA